MREFKWLFLNFAIIQCFVFIFLIYDGKMGKNDEDSLMAKQLTSYNLKERECQDVIVDDGVEVMGKHGVNSINTTNKEVQI